MVENPSNGSPRLDSWKAIAAYLGRDERTVQRWERKMGLPVRRLPGGRGTSVFAYAAELDAWLTENEPAAASAPEVPAEKPAASGTAARWYPVTATVALLLVAGGAAWVALRPATTGSDFRVDLTPTALVAFGNGREQWRHEFAGQRVEAPNERQRHPADILTTVPRAIVAATAVQISVRTEALHGGQVLALTPTGALVRSFTFDEKVGFGADAYSPPWTINDFRVYDNSEGRRIAVAGHHFQWWPGMVVLLDADLRRLGTFINAGWLERVHWLSSDRLVVSGFSNARDGGVVALLDAAALDGQSPEEPGTQYYCRTCGAARPLRYVVLPRSELNRVTGARFNRARFEVHDKDITVRTYEMQVSDTDAADALYEFTPSLDLVNASFSERYWEEHRALELQGRVGHTRAQCPDRDGPREIQMWEPRQGWRTVPATGTPQR